MEWIELTATTEFVDAARLWQCLDDVAGAPRLYDIAAARFVGAPSSETDEPALDRLVTHGFLEIPRDLRHAIDRFRTLVEDTGPLEVRLAEAYRRLRAASLQLKRVEKDRGGSQLFKKTAERWEQHQRHEDLEREITELALDRKRIEGELEKSGAVLRNLMDSLLQDPTLREAYWHGDRPVLITYDGQFLLDYLREMNPANFQGRSLAEILEIGPSLA